MTSTEQVCVVCQEPLVVNNNVVPLPCMHTYHRECLKGYVTSKRQCRADVDCPICRQVAFHFGTDPYDEFHMSLCEPHEVQQILPRPITPIRHVTVQIHQVRPSEIVIPIRNTQSIDEAKRFRFSSKFFLALVIIIALFAIIMALIVSYNLKKQ